VLATGKNAHAAIIDSANKFLFVTNLGSDQVLQFAFDASTGALTPAASPRFEARAGAGPRHLVFHPNGRYAYLLNELDAGVDLLAYDAQRGNLSLLKTWSTLPAGFSGKPWAADLHLTPDGRFLYTSERNSNTLAMWAVDSASGELSLLGHQATERQPRGFQIDPSGRWLLAVGQLSNALTAYRIDPQSGRLTMQASLPVGQNPNWVEIVKLP
jgi:6-phosphogluconolactonase